MSQWMWYVAAAATGVLVYSIISMLVRVPMTRAAVLEEVRRMLWGGVVEQTPGRGPQARGRLGQLEVTVDLADDHKRRSQSPMWRVLAVGPVRLERPVEVTVGDWKGWIDPWMQLAETRTIPGHGPMLSAHAEVAPTVEHPVIAALHRHHPALAPGALHARPDLMRAEVRFFPRVAENRGLFAYLGAMAEISDSPSNRTRREAAPRAPRTARTAVAHSER
jgi:hypothetical protein